MGGLRMARVGHNLLEINHLYVNSEVDFQG